MLILISFALSLSYRPFGFCSEFLTEQTFETYLVPVVVGCYSMHSIMIRFVLYAIMII